MNTTAQVWNPSLYQQKHAFVWQSAQDLIDLLAPQPGERILDLGCGTGQLTAQIATTGADVLGLDHAPEMIEQATKNYPDLAFTVADAQNFQVEPPFDAVFSNAALHWMRQPEAVIRCVDAALKPNGRFVAEFGGKGNVAAVVTALQQALLDVTGLTVPSPWYFPSISEYTVCLEQQGFEVVFAALFDRPTRLEGRSGLANWLQMFAQRFLADLNFEQQQQVTQSVEDRLGSTFQDDAWNINYRRIRVVARKGS